MSVRRFRVIGMLVLSWCSVSLVVPELAIANKRCHQSACQKGNYFSTRYKKCYRYAGKPVWTKPRCKRGWRLNKDKGVCLKRACASKKTKQPAKGSANKPLPIGIASLQTLPNLRVREWRGVNAAGSCSRNKILGYLEIVVVNTGKGYAKPGWVVEFYNPQTPDWTAKVRVDKGLAPGESTKVVGEIKMRSKKFMRRMPSYTFYPNLDAHNHITESDENDNRSGDPMTLFRPKRC